MILGLYGTGGFGRECLPLALALVNKNKSQGWDLVFVKESPKQPKVEGVPVMSHADFLNLSDDRGYSIAIANSQARERLSSELDNSGCSPVSLISERTVIL